MLIQKIHRYLANPLAIIPLCLLILLVTTSAKAHPAMESTQYNGEELFRGIFFAQGPVADRVATLKAFDINRFIKDKAKLQEATDLQNQVMAYIKRNNSDYLQELQGNVASKDHYQIKASLVKGKDLFIKATEAVTGQKRDQAKEAAFNEELNKRVDLQNASGEEIGAALESMSSNIIIIDIWILLPVCLIALCWVVVTFASLEMHPNGLFQERLVSEIAKL